MTLSYRIWFTRVLTGDLGTSYSSVARLAPVTWLAPAARVAPAVRVADGAAGAGGMVDWMTGLGVRTDKRSIFDLIFSPQTGF